MKTYLFKTMTIALSATLFFTGCSDDDDNDNNTPQEPTLAATLEGDARFSILVEALNETGLASTLDASGEYTVFAPTNAAFNDLFTDLGVSDLDGAINAVGAAELTTILQYHLLNSEVRASQVTTGYVSTVGENSAGNNLSAYIAVAGNGTITLNDLATVQESDITARNGVAHAVDFVIRPLNVYQIVEVNPSYSNLESLLKSAGVNLDLVLANESDTYTVFAPDNAAFDTLVANTPNVNDLFDLANDLGSTVMTRVLLYHVIEGDVRESDLSIGQTTTAATDASGSPLSFNVDISMDGTVTISDLSSNSPTATVMATNITGVNGTVHLIDNVLLPQ